MEVWELNLRKPQTMRYLKFYALSERMNSENLFMIGEKTVVFNIFIEIKLTYGKSHIVFFKYYSTINLIIVANKKYYLITKVMNSSLLFGTSKIF